MRGESVDPGRVSGRAPGKLVTSLSHVHILICPNIFRISHAQSPEKHATDNLAIIICRSTEEHDIIDRSTRCDDKDAINLLVGRIFGFSAG